MIFIYLHVKCQLPSFIIVNVTAIGSIKRVGLMLAPYEAWCPAPTDQVGHCCDRMLFLKRSKELRPRETSTSKKVQSVAAAGNKFHLES